MPSRSFETATAYARRFAACFVLWLVIAGPEAWIMGFPSAGIAAHASLWLLPARTDAVRLLRVVWLVPGFLWASVLGGLDVIRRALHPRMPLNPGWIAYRSRLPSSGARAALGSDLSLMPGTLVAGGHGDCLYIHCLDVDQAVGSQIAREEGRVSQMAGTENG